MVGDSLTILHADDSSTVTPSLIDPAVTEVDLYGVWASAQDDVWAVGGIGMGGCRTRPGIHRRSCPMRRWGPLSGLPPFPAASVRV